MSSANGSGGSSTTDVASNVGGRSSSSVDVLERSLTNLMRQRAGQVAKIQHYRSPDGPRWLEFAQEEAKIRSSEGAGSRTAAQVEAKVENLRRQTEHYLRKGVAKREATLAKIDADIQKTEEALNWMKEPIVGSSSEGSCDDSDADLDTMAEHARRQECARQGANANAGGGSSDGRGRDRAAAAAALAPAQSRRSDTNRNHNGGDDRDDLPVAEVIADGSTDVPETEDISLGLESAAHYRYLAHRQFGAGAGVVVVGGGGGDVTKKYTGSWGGMFSLKPGQWRCDICRGVNEASDSEQCQVCETPAVTKKYTGSWGGMFSLKPGQWRCDICRGVNEASDTEQCQVCETRPAAEGGASGIT